MTTHIRPTTLDDLETLGMLWYAQAAIIGQADGRFGPPPDALDRWQSAMRDALDDPTAILLTAEVDAIAIGFVTGWVPPVVLLPGAVGRPLGLICELVIDAHHYHPGAARLLVAELRAAFAGRGVAQVVALSPRNHVVGQAFWRAQTVIPWVDTFWLSE